MICGLYGKEFIHKLVVTYRDGIFQLRLHVHDNYWCPIVISMQTDDQQQFLDFIYKELKDRLIHRSDYLKVELLHGRK